MRPDLRSAVRSGKDSLQETAVGFGLVALGIAAGAVIYWDLSRRGWASCRLEQSRD